ncbi:hypothetical protein VE03_02348 [Pseudogymnoascus sp. 23342-1-I1]|nr:hypothetical protein VE03_02348 [Pseudogymnoascus sp. 23342-1-I1]
MKVTMRSTVALTLAAFAFGAAATTAHITLEEAHEHHATVVATETTDCSDGSTPPAFTVGTLYTLPSDIPFPTKFIDELTSLIIGHSSAEVQQTDSTTCTSAEEQQTASVISTSAEEQQTASVISTSVEVQPTASSAVASTSTEEVPIVHSTVPASTSTEVQSTFVTVPVSSESVPAIVSTSADAHSEAPTQTAPTTIAEQPSTTEAIVPPVTSTEAPLINPLRPSVTPSDTPTTASITLTTTATLPGASIPPVKEGVSHVPSDASEAIIPIPPVTQGVPPVDSSVLSLTTETLTHSNTAVVTVIHNPTHSPFAVDCFSTTYVTVYSPPAPQATASSAVPAIIQNTTVVATGVPHPVHNTTTTTNTTTGQITPPIHGAAPTLSATPGLLLAFCGLICYLI